jgi:acetylornithine deacetylase/succinyl-diaminopimelate desuccinylase-like protein
MIYLSLFGGFLVGTDLADFLTFSYWRCCVGNPYLLAAHLDVVPSGDTVDWDFDPFLGEIVNQVSLSVNAHSC